VLSLTGGWACLISPCVNTVAPSLLIRSVPLTIGIFQNFVKVGGPIKAIRDLASVWIE
jgi:hypothetical protein